MPRQTLAERAERLARIGADAARHRQALPPIRFVVLTPGRAGSKLLIELLGSHPDVRCDFELLYRRVRAPARHVLLAALESGTAGSRAWGFSLQPRHLIDNRVLDIRSWVGRLQDFGVRPIVLVRANPVAQAISAMIVKATTGLAHIYGEEKAHAGVRLDLDLLVRTVAHSEQEVFDIHELVSSRSHISLVYEDDLVDAAAQKATIERVLDYLTLERVPLSAPIARRRTPLREQVSNWEAVEDVLRATRWAPYFDDLEPAAASSPHGQ